ncbi:RHTO0S02e07778g1_1 [Rhodotorula toruloides]|uniref:RHTO0S02e07778g1_1 n=2 Tax=Rhodotorula toruloides TaxID=5286 RepID=A0A061AND1_RHOTO|nr:RHTO0S02e07778g1_1 [Rhodotorula toruloides]
MAPRGRSSIVQSGTEAFTENLHVNYCLCGEFILVVDAPLASLPRRPADSSHCLVNTGPSKRVYKLNITETSKDYKPPEVPKQTEDTLVVNQYGAAGKNGNGVLVNRDGGFEFQRRLFCPRCQLQVGYETVPGEGQKGDATFILAGALSDIQNKAPAEAFGEPTVTPAGNLADQGAREAVAAA